MTRHTISYQYRGRDDGVLKIIVSDQWPITTEVVPWGTHEKIQFCEGCGEAYSAHSPARGCFSCVVGTGRRGRS
jgi:hypothetical protein